MRAHGADLEGLDGKLQVIDGACGRSEVVNPVQPVLGPVDVGGNVVVDEIEIGPVAQVGDVGEVAGDEVVHRRDAESCGEKFFAKVACEESGAAGDKGAGRVGTVDGTGIETGERCLHVSNHYTLGVPAGQASHRIPFGSSEIFSNLSFFHAFISPFHQDNIIHIMRHSSDTSNVLARISSRRIPKVHV